MALRLFFLEFQPVLHVRSLTSEVLLIFCLNLSIQSRRRRLRKDKEEWGCIFYLVNITLAAPLYAVVGRHWFIRALNSIASNTEFSTNPEGTTIEEPSWRTLIELLTPSRSPSNLVSRQELWFDLGTYAWKLNRSLKTLR